MLKLFLNLIKDRNNISVGQKLNTQPNTQVVGKSRVFAVGRMQIIPKTMREAIKAGVISEADRFDKKTQEKVFDYLLTRKRPQIKNYIEEKGSLEDAKLALAREWASMPSPITRNVTRKNEKTGKEEIVTFKKGKSYYGGANKEGVTLDVVEKVLVAAQKSGNYEGLKTFIGEHESNNKYNAYNQGTKNKKIIKSKTEYDFSGMTVGEILNASNNAFN